MRTSSYLAMIGMHWLCLMALTIPLVFSETEIHRQDANGNVTVEVIRTPREQQLAEHAYDMGDGATGYFLDTASGRAISKAEYEKQVHEQIEKVRSDGQRIFAEAQGIHDAGNMSTDEYRQVQGTIRVLNDNLSRHESSFKDSIASAKPKPDHISTPQRQIKVIERRVLVSG